MTHRHNQQTPEADRCRGVDRSLLEFLKPKAEERYSKLEAYCDLLSKASSGAYQSPGTDGALQLLPGQFVATISELARQWQWQRATVRQFISRLIKLGQLSVEPISTFLGFQTDGIVDWLVANDCICRYVNEAYWLGGGNDSCDILIDGKLLHFLIRLLCKGWEGG